MRSTLKSILIVAGLALSSVSITAYAWHGHGPKMMGNGPGEHCYWTDAKGSMQGPNVSHRRGRPMPHHAVHTFGMDAQEAQGLMDEMKKELSIESKQEKAWSEMSKAYVDLASLRQKHYDRYQETRSLSRQMFLEQHAKWLQEHAQVFNTYVISRAQLEKVLSKPQLERMQSFGSRIVCPGFGPRGQVKAL